MDTVADVVRRLWGLCNFLRDDGISYHEYLSELSTLLFLKLAEERAIGVQLAGVPSWTSLAHTSDAELLSSYRQMIWDARTAANPKIREIFSETETRLKSPHALRKLVTGISEIDWYTDRSHIVGDIYEGLIEKNASESRYGAGQYFTPRALVEAMVAVTQPTHSDSVYDPAAGTAGFLISAAAASQAGNDYAKIAGQELVPDVHRMALMNIMIHGFEGDLGVGDTLSLSPERLAVTLCLTNPPFGVRGGLAPNQQNLLQYPTSNKQLAFLQHAYTSLEEGGRAAVVVPDNVLFESGVASSIRSHMLDNYNVHTILRLPPGIFYATGVRTSVLFFAKTQPTETVWTYDLRSGGTSYTKKRQLSSSDLKYFISSYGPDPLGMSPREESETFYSTSRKELGTLGETLDIPSPRSFTHVPGLTPELMVDSLIEQLQSALDMARDMAQIISEPYSRDLPR
ncbi:N-6 DNA methylase [Dactylosporangium roseum]|uniref:site-specific DNA-methyltransferase (adenine-specific) n=1 Tax=Dactylosporangium roseum TaxID=47989 RepID=A0ABY5Z2X0_9ACTN|nr:type I restriction-modification system subunit M [Dactylosporangium roseum]UWZ36380.1 N-6 DNA methylase [Dactylosporangium roseum]